MKIKNIICNILIILILIVLLNICYSKFILKDDLIKLFGNSFLIVTTGSMEPTINAGDLIIISEQENYKKGDIITYQDDENYMITHRIIDINDKTFVAKGDANNLVDEENSNSNIKGKVIYSSKFLGFFVIYLLKPIVIIYIVLFITINIFFYKKEEKIIEKNSDNQNIS